MTEKQLVDGIAREKGEPDVAWVRGECPVCGGPVVSNFYYCGGKGYVCIWECWNGLGEERSRTCDYRKVY